MGFVFRAHFRGLNDCSFGLFHSQLYISSEGIKRFQSWRKEMTGPMRNTKHQRMVFGLLLPPETELGTDVKVNCNIRLSILKPSVIL